MRGRAFGAALTAAVDDALVDAFGMLDSTADVALVALGSYGRGELCPGSDIDVLLVHRLKGRRTAETVRTMTEQLWYPLWDAGFVTGHGARTVKESVALADDDLDALTALLEVRPIAGAADLAAELEHKARELARRRSGRVLPALAAAVELRRQRPGAIAEMLEPDLKEGGGGLRDVQSLDWGGWALGEPGGTAALIERDLLTPADLSRIEAGRELLLDIRVALQRVTGSHSDRLALQEHDAVAAQLGFDSADALVHDLAPPREIAWIAGDAWSRIGDTPSRHRVGRRPLRDQVALAEGVWLRDGRVHIDTDPDGSVPTLRTLEAACAAAEHAVPFDRASLTSLQATGAPTWDVWQRAGFVRLLRSGADAVPVFEALDHEGVLARCFPSGSTSARSRNGTRTTASPSIGTCSKRSPSARVCSTRVRRTCRPGGSPRSTRSLRACRRPELLLLGALLHDISKGLPGDHSEVGEHTAEQIVRRMGFDSEAREVLPWLVRNHLLMAEVATRRDLSDASVADNVAAACSGDAERLRLLYLLTIGDSKATGPAAWNPSKAALVRDLFVKAAAAIERGEAKAVAADRRDALREKLGAERAGPSSRLPEQYVLAFDVDTMCMHEELLADAPMVRCKVIAGGHVAVTVVAPDRPGLLVMLAGALTVSGLDVHAASLFGTTDGLALDVFHGADPFGRVADDDGARVAQTIERALAGEIDLSQRVEERRRSYAPITKPAPAEVHVDVNSEESETDTVVEVHADDDIGLLYRLASAFTELALDVRIAKVATLGKRVVDVFYVRDSDARKIEDSDAIAQLRELLVARIAGE